MKQGISELTNLTVMEGMDQGDSTEYIKVTNERVLTVSGGKKEEEG